MRVVLALCCIATGFYLLGYNDGLRIGHRRGIDQTISEVERQVNARQ